MDQFTWEFIFAVFALWRISRMVVLEDGPLFVFVRWRNLIGVYEDAELGTTSSNWFGAVFTCPLCLSTWLAAPITLYLQGFDVLYWLALAGATCILFKFTER